ncbi:MAG: cupin domain-containing protein [Actinobacteria bacterium]|nr:MAG: cupin domain-containing protein [Actinomycetota bacterium]
MARAGRGGRADDQRGGRSARRGLRDSGTVRRRRDLRGARRRDRRRDPDEAPAIRRRAHRDAPRLHAGRGRGDRQEAVSGYAFTSLEELGDGPGFRKVRTTLGVTAFGVNGIVFAPGFDGFLHFHDRQDELYFVHRGRARVDVGGETRELGEGGLVHVESKVPRKVSNASDTDELVLLVVGGKDGYVERDGHLVDPERDLARRRSFGSSG